MRKESTEKINENQWNKCADMDILFGLLALSGDTVIALVFVVMIIVYSKKAINQKYNMKENKNARQQKPRSWRDYRG